MSFLAPLYFAGALAVALPIVLHLIRRTPRERLPFSTLMFLSESPPRVTRRSRLENLFLLLLRGAVLCGLAAAFARPFLRQPLQTAVATPIGRIIAVLVDTSASMRRPGIWPQVAERVDRIMNESRPDDSIALYSFDGQLHSIVSFEEWHQAPIASRREWLTDKAKQLEPSWGRTELGRALATVAEAIEERAGELPPDRVPEQRIVLVSDLPRGADTSGLDQYEWPDHVRLEVERVRANEAGNAGMHWVADAEDAEAAANSRPRVRITNAEDSENGQFRIQWAKAGVAATEVYVAPGRSRVILAPDAPAESAQQLLLTGDSQLFDNDLYAVIDTPKPARVLFVGSGNERDLNSLRFYFDRAVAGSGYRTVQVAGHLPDRPITTADLADTRLVVIAESVPEETTTLLRKFVESSGTLLVVCRDLGTAEWASALLPPTVHKPVEGTVDDYVMLGAINFSHPLFAPFSEPRFSDFTKIHFWKYRRFEIKAQQPPPIEEPSITAGGATSSTTTAESSSDDSHEANETAASAVQIVARFDNRDPALIETSIGKGNLFVLTSSWHADDSQLGVSSKFVPLVMGLVDLAYGRADSPREYHVGDVVTFGDEVQSPITVVDPDGTERVLAESARRFEDTHRPGVYEVKSGGQVSRFAVNVDASESRTAPMPIELLEQMGVRLTTTSDLRKMELAAANERQMQAEQLEERQKLWRWVLLAVCALLLVETWLAGWLSRRAPVGSQ